MATFQDTAKTTVIVDGKQGINELGKLEMEAAEYRKALKGMRKDTQQWININNKLKGVKSKIADVRKELGLSGMTMRQLRSYQRELMREMDVTTTRGTKRYKELNAQLQQVNARIRTQRMEVRGMATVWSKMGGGLKSSLAVFGPQAAIVAGIYGAIEGLKNFVRTFVNLQKENSKLAGILRVNTTETKQLRQQQRELGMTTEHTATQVAKAQIELAKLGKTQQEIIEMTPALLSGATAMGVDMASAAELVAGQMNAFQEETSETSRVVDVLSKATQISAFDFERLKTSLAIVSPAAKASNAELEQTLAILSAAIDANIDASSAGTALRNIFIDIADKGLTLEEALNKIRNSQNKLTTANELFGKRGAVVATVIAENIEKIDMQTKSLENAAGTAQEFADKQLDNISGDIKILTSVWEGFVLAIENGDGALSRFIRGSLQSLTEFISLITPELEEQNSVLEDQKDEFNTLLTILTELNPQGEERIRILGELNTKYKEYLPNILTEKTDTEQLLAIQKQVNDQLLLRIILQEKEAELKRINDARIETAQRINELQKDNAQLTRDNNELDEQSANAALQAQFHIVKAKDEQIKFNKQVIETNKQEIEDLRNLGNTASRIGASVADEIKAIKKELNFNQDDSKGNSSIGDIGTSSGEAESETGLFDTISNEIDLWHQEKLLKLKEQRNQELITAEEFNKQEEELLLAHLISMKELLEQDGQDTLDIQQKIADQEYKIFRRRAKIQEDAKQEQLDQNKQTEESNIRTAESYIRSGMAAIENADNVKDATRGILDSIRQQIKAEIAKAIAKGIGKEIGGKGILGLITGTALGAGAAALFDKMIPTFYHGNLEDPRTFYHGNLDGGYRSTGLRDKYGPLVGSAAGGMFHGGEGIIPAYIRQEPEVMNAEAIIAATQAGYSLNNSSQSNRTTSGSVSLDTGKFAQAVDRFEMIISVLQKEGLWSKFSRDEYQDATEDYNRKESTRNRGRR